MNENEVAEIRRRFRPEKSNITCVRGCYVNENREIVSQFNQSLALTPQEESEKILTLLKKTLSGTLGKNLIDISFETRQVIDSEEHSLLMELKNSALHNEDAVQAFFEKIIEVLSLEGQYLILLSHDTYDVPYRGKDGEKLEDASSDVFSYILCSICPVKTTKPALCYDVPENMFRSQKADWLVSPPELGFMFPAFDDRCANIYGALYYTKNTAENHGEFVDRVFHTEIPMPAEEQKETFHSLLSETLAEDCSYDVVQTVHEQLCEKIEEHKANKEEEPLAISKRDVCSILQSCGVSQEKMVSFEEKYNEEFGKDTEIPPRNVVDPKRLELRTPDVTVQVNPERRDLVETRVINGCKYILIRADEGVEVNGIRVHIT